MQTKCFLECADAAQAEDNPNAQDVARSATVQHVTDGVAGGVAAEQARLALGQLQACATRLLCQTGEIRRWISLG